MSANKTEPLIQSDNDDIDELRKLAIISMGKQGKITKNDYVISKSIVPQLNFNDNENFSKFKKNHCHFPRGKRFSPRESKNKAFKKIKLTKNDDLREENISNYFAIDNIIKVDEQDVIKNMLKEEELKNKLLKSFRLKRELDSSGDKCVEDVRIASTSTKQAFKTRFNESHANLSLCKNAFNSNALKCNNLITQLKLSIDEIQKSINTMSDTIQQNLNKYKNITAQIKNLKIHKTELHKSISITRKKILDLNKIKKQKHIDLFTFRQLEKKFKFQQSELQKMPVPLMLMLSDSSSKLLNDKIISRHSDKYDIDCNRIICTSWIYNNCFNKKCIYQHPKLISKSTAQSSKIKVKGNEEVIVKEMSPKGFVVKLMCDACSEKVLIPTIHITEDRHCKSCCQQLVEFFKPVDILNQLIIIWHHLYKRFIISRNLSIEVQDQSILSNLCKCSQAMIAKLYTSSDLPKNLFEKVGRHIIVTLSEEHQINDFLDFMKKTNYNSNLVLFVVKNMSFPIHVVHKLLINSIDFHFHKSKCNKLFLLIKEFCFISKCLDHCNIIDHLMNWFSLCVENKDLNSHKSLISKLIKIILKLTLEPHILPNNISLSMNDMQLSNKYWNDRKNVFMNIYRLISNNVFDFIDYSVHMLLIKYIVLCQFFTGDEENSLELCTKYSNQHFVFQILLSKLSLACNSSFVIGEHELLLKIEHWFNKSEWLQKNRSVESSVKVLENISLILYKNYKTTISIDFVDLYEFFLGLPSKFDCDWINLASAFNDRDRELIRKSSSLWLCYINLLVITNKIHRLHELLKSDSLFLLPQDHLNRVFQSIITHFGNVYIDDQYYGILQSIFLSLEKLIDFYNFIDLVQSINFDKLLKTQLKILLFLIDYCVIHFSKEDVDSFLVSISWKLLLCRNDYSNSCIMFRHITMCYPIRTFEVWLNYIQLHLNINSTLYELIDVCECAVNRFKFSKLLWKQYYILAKKTDDKEFETKIRDNAEKLGFDVQ